MLRTLHTDNLLIYGDIRMNEEEDEVPRRKKRKKVSAFVPNTDDDDVIEKTKIEKGKWVLTLNVHALITEKADFSVKIEGGRE